MGGHMDNNYFVYMYVFPNGKRYIGQSHDGAERYGSISRYKRSVIVYRAMKKYSDFKKYIIWRGPSDKVDDMERHFIYFFRATERKYGYNICKGGHPTKKELEETRRLKSLHNNHYWKGRKMPESMILHLREHSYKKKKVRCKETGMIYNSVREASRATGFCHQDISACAKGTKRFDSVHGYHWEYIKEDKS
jgi:hypothetical protein